MNPHGRRPSHGFSLIELLVTVMVLGVILALGIPNLRDFIVSNRLISNVNSFVGLVNYARSEAIVRNQNVVICPKNDTAITCATSSAWNQYEVQAFVDANGNGERDSGEVLLKTVAAIDTTNSQMKFERDGGAGVISFQSLGYSRTAQRFNIHAVSTDSAYENKYGRALCISTPGRVRVVALQTVNCTNF